MESHQYINRHGEPSVNVLFGVGASGQFYLCDPSNPGGVQDNKVLKRAYRANRLSDRPLITDGIIITDGGFSTVMANLCNPIVTSSTPWNELCQTTGLTQQQIQQLFNNYNEIFKKKRNSIERYAFAHSFYIPYLHK